MHLGYGCGTQLYTSSFVSWMKDCFSGEMKHVGSNFETRLCAHREKVGLCAFANISL